ncbi:MAG: hypothetical protein QM760_16320 [Nibricoccus sp.]
MAIHRHSAKPGVSVFLAGDFNGWQEAVGKDELAVETFEPRGRRRVIVSAKAERFYGNPPM